MLPFLLSLALLHTTLTTASAGADSKSNFTLHRPVYSQFYTSNRAISPFIVANNSILPAGLRLPPAWSFSIGFVWDTYLINDGQEDVFYSGSLANGSELPEWMSFSTNDITFQGVSPADDDCVLYKLALKASNKKGELLGQQPFNFTIVSRDVSVTTAVLPPLNLTASAPFSYSLIDLLRPYLLIDGKKAGRSDFKSLNFTLSNESPNWASIVDGHICGTAPPTSSGNLFLELQDSMNTRSMIPALGLTIPTPIGPVSSMPYFTIGIIPPAIARYDAPFEIDLSSYFSKGNLAADLVVSFEPNAASSWLSFETISHTLHGSVPATWSSNHVNVELKATDKSSGAISTASLYISLQQANAHPDASGGASSSPKSHRKTIIAAVIGVLGGFALLCCIVAVMRRSVGQKAEDARIRPGPRTGGPREYVIDQLDDPFADKNHPPPNGPGDDLESQAASDTYENPTSPVLPVREPRNMHASPTHISKREFFKPSMYHPARFLRAEPANMESIPRKTSSTIHTFVQNTIRSFSKTREMPNISKPLPYQERRPIPGSNSSNSGRSLDKNAPPVPSRRTALSLGSVLGSVMGKSSAALAPASQSTSSSSLEGGVSIGGVSENDGIVGADSHVWAHRPRISPTAGNSRRPDVDSLEGSPPLPTSVDAVLGRRYGNIVPVATTNAKNGSAYKAGIAHDTSEDMLDGAVVQQAYSINVKDRTSEPKLRRYSSINSALENPNRFSEAKDALSGNSRSGSNTSPPMTENSFSDPSLRVLAGGANAFQSTGTLLSTATNTSRAHAALGPSNTVGLPAVVKTRDARRPVPEINRSGSRNVSDKVEYGSTPPKDNTSSHTLPAFQEQDWRLN